MSKVLGLGAIGIDYIAYVNNYPKEDEKIRVIDHYITGGGNCTNTLTTISRLGIITNLISKWGNDSHGSMIMKDLQSDNISFYGSIQDIHGNSGFTYVIVDNHTKTRTCIHTPIKQDITSLEINNFIMNLHNNPTSLINSEDKPMTQADEVSYKSHQLGQDHVLLHLDGRHTEAAYILALKAKDIGLSISIDCEKDRPPFFQRLLLLSNYIFTNQHFCQQYLFILQESSQDYKEFLSNICYVDKFNNLSSER